MKYGLYTCRGTCQCSTQLYHGPGSHGFVKQDAQWLADAGADYLKEDSCCAECHWAAGVLQPLRMEHLVRARGG
jgi:hypothetical protein